MPSATEDTDDSGSLQQTFQVKSKKDVSAGINNNTNSLVTDEMEGISPLMLGRSKEVDEFDLENTPKASSYLLSHGPPSRQTSGTRSPVSLRSRRQQSLHSPSDGANLDSDTSVPTGRRSKHRRSKEHKHGMNHVIDEVVAWLQAEKAKQKARKTHRKPKGSSQKHVKNTDQIETPQASSPSHSRRSSNASEDALDLEELESILERNLVPINSLNSSRRASSLALKRYGSRSSQLSKRLTRYQSSDTEVGEDDPLVPSCDVILDNSRTLNLFNSLTPEARNTSSGTQENEARSTFKYEIVRLSHTLKLTGWRQVPLEQSDEISVERLSGALTNAVYVVTAPSAIQTPKRDDNKTIKKKRKPLKLLLRIYGPNVEHLIDREAELRILKRLARKQIGPRLLGTFRNGRFEEYLHARPLRPQELRDPDTSKQIAKRMRELHDGIELLPEERLGGPFVWRSWDKWLARAECITTRLDSMRRRRRGSVASQSGSHWLEHAFVCGTSWNFFRSTVEQYRRQLETMYGSKAKVQEQLIFAHNDTQYGNILRIEPPGESPLLLPANQHKQLVVIDFEYSNANVPGIEFANHFTEWCYNYHDPTHAFACNTKDYPTLEEQRRFIRAYVLHRPEHTPAALSTPRYTPMHPNPSLTSISSLSLEPRKSQSFSAEEDPLDHIKNAMPTPTSDVSVNAEIERLMQETRMWRIANAAFWVVWGILQATLPKDIDSFEGENHESMQYAQQTEEPETIEGSTDAAKDDSAEEHSFDYLRYSRERAMLFWGDCLQFGLVSEEDLGEAVMKDVKIVRY